MTSIQAAGEDALRRCQNGSCFRHKACMYSPCRAPEPRVHPEIETALAHSRRRVAGTLAAALEVYSECVTEFKADVLSHTGSAITDDESTMLIEFARDLLTSSGFCEAMWDYLQHRRFLSCMPGGNQ